MKIRRIVVGLERAPRNRDLLDASAALAGRMEAELVGLFVENIDLLHFAGLPFACEVGTVSAARRGLDVGSMERTLRTLAQEAQQSLAAAAGRVPVRWSFRVVRCSAATGLLAAATEADLVVANIAMPKALDHPVPVRVVRAGDPRALRAALESGDGILVLAGADESVIGGTLRELIEQEWT